jgi:hypothetical protein
MELNLHSAGKDRFQNKMDANKINFLSKRIGFEPNADKYSYFNIQKDRLQPNGAQQNELLLVDE